MKIAKNHQPRDRQSGFSLIEALVGMVLIGIAMLGLVQVFLISIRNNNRAGEITNASFLAQERIDYLRTLTAEELNAFPAVVRGESIDENIDLNADAQPDFRRITLINQVSLTYDVKVLVFPALAVGTDRDALVSHPSEHRARAVVSTVIGR